jgi:hypothetical protein
MSRVIRCQANGCVRKIERADVRTEVDGTVTAFCIQHRREYDRLVGKSRSEFGGGIVYRSGEVIYPKWKRGTSESGNYYYASKKGFHGY